MNPILILLFLTLRIPPLTSKHMDEYQYDRSILDGDPDDLSISEEAYPESTNEDHEGVTHVPKSKKIPVTTSLKKIATKFVELINKPTYVDKTHFLQTLFESRRRSQMNVITSPKGFGKTSLMNMVKFFAQIEVDPMGKPLQLEKMQSFSVFGNESSNLNISQSLGIIYDEMGQYPVIYLNLKYIIGKNIKTTWRNLQSRLKKLFLEYRWMVNKIQQKYKFKRYDCTVNEKLQNSVMQKIMTNTKVNADVFEMSLFVFSEALYMHFKKRVLVLIDDFDDPLIEMATHPEADFPRDRVTQVIGNMLDRLLVGIDKLKYVDAALLTGTNHVRLSITFDSYAKLFKFNRFLDGHPFAKYFGFTETEVKDLFKKHNLDRKDLEMVKKLHNGYETLNERNPTILYCPQSVLSFLGQKFNQSRPFLPLIENPPLTKFVRILKHDKIRTMVSELLVSKPIIFAVARRLEYEDLEHLGQVLNDKSSLDGDAVQTFFTFLLDNGYFTNAKVPKAKKTAFQLANFESSQGLANFFFEYATNHENLDLDSIADLLDDIFTNDEVSEEILINLRRSLRKLYPDEENPDTNKYRMQSLIYCTLMKHYLNDSIEVKINSDPDVEREVEIRADILIIKRSRAMIIEIGEETTAREALEMAEENLARWKTKKKLRVIKYLGLSFDHGRKIRVGYKDNTHKSPIIIKKLPKQKE